MFCPKCSQSQASDQQRFCSRCGFPLTIVADLLAHDGALTTGGEAPESVLPSARQRGVRQGTALLFVGLVVAFVMALLSVFVLGRPELFVPVTAGVILLSGLLRIVYAYMFEPGVASEIRRPGLTGSGATATGHALPPAQELPFAGFGRGRVETAEMVPRPSVTEHTTKLLGKE